MMGHSVRSMAFDILSSDEERGAALPEEAVPFHVVQMTPQQYAAMGELFGELAARAHNPNIFMSPAAVRASTMTLLKNESVIIFCVYKRYELVGVWALRIWRSPWTLWQSVLLAPALPLYEPLGLPVLDASHADEALSALLVHIQSQKQLPNILFCKQMRFDDVWRERFERACATAALHLNVFERWQRAMLIPKAGEDAQSYLARTLNRSLNRLLRKQQALEEQDRLVFKAYRGAEASEAMERFLALEASGWKGKAGTAFLSHPQQADYARMMMSCHAAREQIMIAELSRREQSLAMGVVLQLNGHSLFLKTAYDETEKKNSPGMLLDIDVTTTLLNDYRFRVLDSGMDDSADPETQIWSERADMAHFLIGSTGIGHTLCRMGLSLYSRIRAFKNRRLRS